MREWIRRFRRIAITSSLLAIAASGCALTPRVAAQAQTPQTIADVKGAVTLVNANAGWYGLVPDVDRGTRYAPDTLPEEFRKDGLRVIFSGRVTEPDPNARSWGIPLALTAIRLDRSAR